jgi:hypothetical protein
MIRQWGSKHDCKCCGGSGWVPKSKDQTGILINGIFSVFCSECLGTGDEGEAEKRREWLKSGAGRTPCVDFETEDRYLTYNEQRHLDGVK